jgi:DNA-binding MurR/RpiR family transcriptional regulator
MSNPLYSSISSMNEIKKAIAQSIISNERDLAFHTINLQRFEAILADPELEEGDFKTKLVNEIPVLHSRIKEVSLIIKHAKTQISEEDLEAARELLAQEGN